MDQTTRQLITTTARTHALDRYLSALLAPLPARDDLLTLSAFAGEIERIPMLVSEPQLGEIRLQWWHDCLAAPGGHSASIRTGNPLADEMNGLIDRHGFCRDNIGRLIDARVRDLYADPVASHEDFHSYLADSEGTLFRCATAIVRGPPTGEGGTSNSMALADATGQVYGAARLLQRLPELISKGRFPLYLQLEGALGAFDLNEPEHDIAARQAVSDVIAQVRAAIGDAAAVWQKSVPAIRAANLPLALVEPYLRGFEKSGRDVLREPSDLLPIMRVWRLWTAKQFGWLVSSR